MAVRNPFAVNEWYHCFNRGVDKRTVFDNASDYNRLLLLLYLGNGTAPLHLANLKDHTIQVILEDSSIERGDPLVEIGAYTLMPNHFHFALREIIEGGIATFMQRIFTAYTMYFNMKYERTGALFAGPFKSKRVADDRYLKHLISYLHLNPAELFESKWKEGFGNVHAVQEQLQTYPYSSLPDFLGHHRLERKILGNSIFELYDSIPTLAEIVEDANAYYVEHSATSKS